MKYSYIPKGVCSREMTFDIEDGVIKKVEIIGGCPGNTIGVAKLLEGMNIEEAIKKLKGIKCGLRETSCPDQLARALEGIRTNLKIENFQ